MQIEKNASRVNLSSGSLRFSGSDEKKATEKKEILLSVSIKLAS